MTGLLAERNLRFFYWALVPIAAYFLLVHAIPKLVVTPEVYTDYYWPRRHWLILHVLGGLLATLLGPFQFMRKLRARQLALHRNLGKLYILSVLAAAGSAIVLAFTSSINLAYSSGLCAASTIWIATAVLAFRRVRQRQLDAHRAWMIRNYIVTFFFILFFGVFDLLAFTKWADPMQAVGWLAWLCWLLPLALGEWVLRRRRA